jgi:hypothetical protein
MSLIVITHQPPQNSADKGKESKYGAIHQTSSTQDKMQ